jgi:site-specific DNA recombinase
LTVAKGTKLNNFTKKDKNRRVQKPKDEWVYVEVEPIVSEELWDECNRILDSQAKHPTRPAKKAVHLFAGVTYCGCGGKMYVPSNSPKYTCLQCRNKIGTDDLEEVFHEQIKSFFFSPEEVANYLKSADDVIKEKEELLSALTEEEDKIRQEMSKVYKLYIEDRISSKIFGEMNKPLEERLKQVEDQVPEIQAGIDFLKIQYLSSDQMLHEARDLYTRWPNLSTDEKRAIVEQITEKITVTDDEVTITLAYLPTSSELMANEQRNNLEVAL